MGVRNKKRETLKRLDSKTLDARFLNEIRNGLNCSPFEAQAVLEVVKEVYFPFLDEQSVKAPPGKVTLIAVSAELNLGSDVELREPVAAMLRERHKQGNCEADSIDALHRDGQVRSSVEAAVMAVERRDLVIQLPTIDQLFNRRSHWT